MTEPAAYADLELRILKKQAEGYPVELTLRLPDGSQKDVPRGGYLAPDFVWTRRSGPRENGERLFDLLFADEGLKRHWVEMRGLSRHRRRIRLHFDDTAPELHALPWEFLHDTTLQPSQPLAAQADTPFSRYLAGDLPSGLPVAVRPLKLLVAIANPEDLEDWGLTPIELEAEQETIRKAISDVNQSQVELTFLPPPVTSSSLSRALNDGCHILHIVGHGQFYMDRDTGVQETLLYLEDEGHRAVPVNEQQFAEMLRRRGQGAPKFIFMASCDTAKRPTKRKAETASNLHNVFRGFAPELIRAGVPAVLAMQDIIQVPTAQAFTRTFYRQLFRHGQVDLASNEARAAVLAADLPGSSVPVLFSRLPDNQLLKVAAHRSASQTGGYASERGNDHSVKTMPLAFLKIKSKGHDSLYRIVESSTIIGRAGTCQLEIPDDYDNVERYHATIFHKEGIFTIADGYQNSPTKFGTFVNGTKVKPHTRVPLRHGDRIVLGGFRKKEAHELARGACEIVFEGRS